jgi:hypothetical protein
VIKKSLGSKECLEHSSILKHKSDRIVRKIFIFYELFSFQYHLN